MRRMILAALILMMAGHALAHSGEMPDLLHAVAHGGRILAALAVVAVLLPAFRRS